MRDAQYINPKIITVLTNLYRRCSFISSASKKRASVVLNGGLNLKIGGLVALPDFDESAHYRLIQNLERASHWIDVVGFIPFSVDPTEVDDSDEEQYGSSVGIGSDIVDEGTDCDADIGGQNGNPNSSSSRGSQMKRRGAKQNAKLSACDEESRAGRTKTSTRSKDFDFTVPSVGVGRFQVYRDSRDNSRRIVYIDDEEDEGGCGAQTASSASDSGKGGNEDDDGNPPKKRVWYVYVVEEPLLDATPSSPLARLEARYRYLEGLEASERRGAELGFNPIIVTEPQPPGKGLRNLDHHTGFMTDAEAVSGSTDRNGKGLPPGFTRTFQEAIDRYRDILSINNIDPDDAVKEYTQGGNTRFREHNVRDRRHFSTTIAPHTIIDIEKKQRDYVRRVAIEFGVPESDLGESNSRFKEDRDSHSSSLIESSRQVRGVLVDLLQRVFSIKNNGRLTKTLVTVSSQNREQSTILKSILDDTKKLLEEAKKEATSLKSFQNWRAESSLFASPAPSNNGSMVGQTVNMLPSASHTDGPMRTGRGATSSKAKGASGGVDSSGYDSKGGRGNGSGSEPYQGSSAAKTTQLNATSSQQMSESHAEASSIQISELPDSVEALVKWIDRVEASFTHIQRVQRVLDDILRSGRPICISWTQPLIADQSQIDTSVSALRMDDNQKAQIARQYYGMIY